MLLNKKDIHEMEQASSLSYLPHGCPRTLAVSSVDIRREYGSGPKL